jgi:hypothetical protein
MQSGKTIMYKRDTTKAYIQNIDFLQILMLEGM